MFPSAEWFSRRTSQIRSELYPLAIEKAQWKWLKGFLQTHKKVFMAFLLCIVAAVFIEAFIPFFVVKYVQPTMYQLQVGEGSMYLLAGILLVLGYASARVLSIWFGNTCIIELQQALRIYHFQSYLLMSRYKKATDRSRLYAQFTHHISLLLVGMRSSFYSFISFVILSFLLFLAAISTSMLWVGIFFIWLFICGFAAWGADLLSGNYIAQEQVLSTKILSKVLLYSEGEVANNNVQKMQQLQSVHDLIAVDTPLRKRRDTLLQATPVLVGMLSILASLFGATFWLYTPLWAEEVLQNPLITGFFALFFMRGLYLAVRIGLYRYALALGTALCIPLKKAPRATAFPNEWSRLRFQSKGMRLLENTKPFPLDITVVKGDHVCLNIQQGAMHLAYLMAGEYRGMGCGSLVVLRDKEQLGYMAWQKAEPNIHLVSGTLQLTETIAEYLSLDVLGYESLEACFKQLPSLADFNISPRWFGTNSAPFINTVERNMALQIFKSVYWNSPMVVLSEDVFAIASTEMKQLLREMQSALKTSVIIGINGTTKGGINWTSTHEIKA